MVTKIKIKKFRKTVLNPTVALALILIAFAIRVNEIRPLPIFEWIGWGSKSSDLFWIIGSVMLFLHLLIWLLEDSL